tara:strand:+ start:205 stop:624 length:420 start_codon:yes stop_codon:yes gene_type:complete
MDRDKYIISFDSAKLETWANAAVALVAEAISKPKGIEATDTVRSFTRAGYVMWGRIIELVESNKELEKATDILEKDPSDAEAFRMLSDRLAEEIMGSEEFAEEVRPFIMQLIRLEKNIRLEPLKNYSNRTQKLVFEDEE